MTWRELLAACMLIVMSLSASMARADDSSFQQWQQQFTAKALDAGIPQNVIDRSFANIVLDDYVVELDHRQPEDKLSYGHYVHNTVSPKRIEAGRALMQEHAALLKRVSDVYQVEPRFIVALWGMETDYGDKMGQYSVVQSLATLAYDGRRRDFFESELINTLKIIAGGQWSADDLVGSWAGAMGNCQFMPSSYLKFAVDYDGDGKADIWHSVPDTLASIANYLHQSGWQPGIGWGKRSDSATAVYPGTKDEGGFDVTDNFAVLLKWNRSRYFASSVGLLADELGK